MISMHPLLLFKLEEDHAYEKYFVGVFDYKVNLRLSNNRMSRVSPYFQSCFSPISSLWL